MQKHRNKNALVNPQKGNWKGINNREVTLKSHKRNTRTAETQYSESDFDLVKQIEMECSTDEDKPKTIHYNPGRKISIEELHQEYDDLEEETRLRELLLKQIETKRKSSSENAPTSPSLKGKKNFLE